ncbi:hypothetical protein M422DRAFT_153487, partial [Sphaerobolus stellatus SS14]
YTMKIGIGKPATMYDVIVDTGSANTWIGNDKPYAKTDTSHKTKNNVVCGTCAYSHSLYLDKVNLGHNLTITNQSIGVATEASGFGTFLIRSMRPYALTLGTLIPEVSKGIHTVSEACCHIYHLSRISSNVLGVSFQPTNNATAENGLLTFGSPNGSHFVGEITYTNIPSSGSAARYWGLKQSIKYGNETTILDNTGATLILLNTTAFNNYKHATGAEMDASVGLLKISNDKLGNLQPLIFDINGTVFELVPDAQLWPRALNGFIGGDSSSSYLIVSDLGEVSGASDLQFVLGYTFLERFYTVYDGVKKRIGIAKTQYTDVKIN